MVSVVTKLYKQFGGCEAALELLLIADVGLVSGGGHEE